MADFSPAFAHLFASKRMPTASEIDNGFGCGPLDLDLFNGLINAFYLELGALITLSGGTPTNANMRQVAEAVQSGGMNFAVATGTANAWTVAPALALPAYTAGRVLWIKAPATNTSTTVNANISTLGNRRVKKADGTDPAAGDLVIGRWYPTIDDGTNVCVVSTLPSDIAAQKALVNLQQTTNATRTVYSSIVGATTVLSGSYTKKSPTSDVVFWVQVPTYVAGASGPAWIRANIGGTARAGAGSNNDSSLARGAASLNGKISGLGAAAHAWTIELGRSDATSWAATVNPSTTDNAYFPSAGINSVIIIGESEP